MITKLLYLANQGDSFTKVRLAARRAGADRTTADASPPQQNEATEVFFSVTKLFQSKDQHLRRCVYLIIKAVASLTGPDEVIIVTSSLMRDATSKNDLYRASSIRVLAGIVDPAMLTQLERYIKQAIVDKQPVVASAACVSALHLLRLAPDVVRRWASEVGEQVQSRHPCVQFHALAIAYAMRATDRLAASKLVAGLTRSGPSARGPLATALLVRFAARVMADMPHRTSMDEPGAPATRPFGDFLDACLRHKSEAVIFEAARAVADMRDVSTRELAPAVTVLQLFLSSSKPVLRFAAARTLNRIATTFPGVVASANVDLEALIGDSNRSVATLAITTLLRTGAESSVERLMKQIQAFLTDIADENKCVVVNAVRALCLKYPVKHRAMLSFLAATLRDEGGFEYKRCIVDAIVALIHDIPEAAEAGLGHLCEFIEDCEFTYLSSQVLHLLGNTAPHTPQPERYIRYVYNRVILENATVRASAVSALAKFGAACPPLRPRVATLLKRCLYDNDDEVRDRATLALAVLHAAEKQRLGAAGGEAAADDVTAALLRDPQCAASLAEATTLLADGAGMHASIPALEQALRAYLASGSMEAPFAVSTVPVEGSDAAAAIEAKASGMSTAAAAAAAAAKSKAAAAAAGGGGGGGGGSHAHGPPGSGPDPQAAVVLAAIPAFATYGPLFKSSAPVQLTEEDTEYAVVLTKHTFAQHTVFAFACSNTIPEQMLSNVTVALQPGDGDTQAVFTQEVSIPLPDMPLQRPGSCFVALRRAGDDSGSGGAHMGSFSASLRFTVREVDPSTGEPEPEGYPDEYSLNDVSVEPGDYIRRTGVGNFRKAWDELGDGGERSDEYGLGPRDSISDALAAVMSTLGLAPCEGSDAVAPHARSHTALLSGVFLGGTQVLVRLQLGQDAQSNVAMKMTVRSADGAVSDAMHSIIASA